MADCISVSDIKTKVKGELTVLNLKAGASGLVGEGSNATIAAAIEIVAFFKQKQIICMTKFIYDTSG